MFLTLLFLYNFVTINAHLNLTINDIDRSKRSVDIAFLKVEARATHIGQLKIEPEIVQCTRKHRNSVAKINDQTKYACKPRKSLIEIQIPAQGVAFFPAAIEVDRCDGICHIPNMKCMPTEMETITIPVQEMKLVAKNTGGTRLTSSRCLEYKIDQHMKCKCACMLKAENCNALQDFNENSCQCICKQNNISDCMKAGKIWNSGTCSCECSQQQQCSSGFTFDKSTCECVSEETTET